MLLANYVSATNASTAMGFIRHRMTSEKRLHVVEQLVRTGLSGSPLGRWLTFIVEQDDYPHISLLVGNRVRLKNDDSRAQRSAMTAKDFPKPGPLPEGRPFPTTLSGLFPLLRQMNTKTERLEASRFLFTTDTAGSGVDNAHRINSLDRSHSYQCPSLTQG